MKKHKKKYNKRMLSIFSATIFVSAMFLLRLALADNSISNISNSGVDAETQKKIDELNRKAEVYREIIQIKQKQQETLNNQLSIMDNNIDQVQSQIEAKKKQIDDLGNQIAQIESQITEKDKSIAIQKVMLSKLIQAYYETSQTNLATIYLSQSNIAAYITNKDRLGQTSDKIKEIVDSLNELRQGLKEQNDTLNGKKNEIVDAHQQLETQNNTLESTKKQKENLLTQTKGEEAQYQQLLARVEEQKQELLDIDQFFAASGLSVDSYPKPDSALFASTGWYYSQRDPKWGNDNIGNTKTLMKSYGCAVTAVAMVFKEHGVSMTPAILANQPIFSGDLINWWDSKDWQKSWPVPDGNGYSHGNINWKTVDAQIAKGNPVIVYIKKSNGGGGHYVVIHHKDSKTGKYVVHDPYFGANIFLDTTRALVGAMGKDSSTSIDQMIIYN